MGGKGLVNELTTKLFVEQPLALPGPAKKYDILFELMLIQLVFEWQGLIFIV